MKRKGGAPGVQGYGLRKHYEVRSRLGNVPVINEYVNEVFPPWTRYDVTNPNNWPIPEQSSAITTGSNGAQTDDWICISGAWNPQPQPLTGTSIGEIYHIQQLWNSGSLQNGSGVNVQTGIIHWYQNLVNLIIQ